MEPSPPGMLEALFENAFQLMGVLDPEGRLLAANRAALTLIGARLEEVLGRPFWETPWWTHDPDAQARLRGAVAEAAEGRFSRLEATHPAAGGGLRTVDFTLTPYRDGTGKVRWLFPEGRDITELKEAERALRESEGKFRQIFLKSQDGILLLDGDRFVDCNPAVLEMMRCTEPELLRMHPWELSPPLQADGRPSPDKAMEMIRLAHAKGGHRFEWIHRRIDGEDFPVEVTLTPFPLGGREILYTTWRDITGRKRDEQERLDLQRQVLHAQKMESLGILAGGIAHDFNNLMTAMLGRLELAALDLDEGHPARHHLEILEDILSRATDLTRQMLAYTGRGRFVVGPLDLGKLAREMAGLLAASISKKVELVLDAGAWTVHEPRLIETQGVPGSEIPKTRDASPAASGVFLCEDAFREPPSRVRAESGLPRAGCHVLGAH